MSTPVTNFGKVTVSAGYDAAATSLALSTGHGSRLPSTFPYPLTWWDSTTYSDPADDPSREIVLVTNRVGDALTVTRAGEGTSASAKNTGSKTYKMVLGITKAMWDALGDLSLSQTFRGLSLQTHTDSNKALSWVRMVHADAIVMSDGEEVVDWNNIDVNIAAALGVGGLDTGSEQAWTWYEVHAVWNGTTKGLMLHRAKNYFLDASYTTEDASQGLRSLVDNSTIRISQGLQFATSGPLVFIDVKLLKTGSPTGNYWFTIEANSGGVPSNTPLATSRKYDAARLTTTAGFVRIPFDAPLSVSAATQYHLVMYGDYTVSAANYVNWRMDAGGASYANGSKALFDSDTSTWTTVAGDDMVFKAYVAVNETSLTIPTGYRSALIGWVYNNGSSDFKYFLQKDRTVLCGYINDWQIGSFTSTTPLLVDVSPFVPPVPCVVIACGNNATSAYVAIGNVSATDVNGLTANKMSGAARVTLGADYTSTFPPLVLEGSQGMMLATNGGTLNLYLGSFEF